MRLFRGAGLWLAVGLFGLVIFTYNSVNKNAANTTDKAAAHSRLTLPEEENPSSPRDDGIDRVWVDNHAGNAPESAGRHLDADAAPDDLEITSYQRDVGMFLDAEEDPATLKLNRDLPRRDIGMILDADGVSSIVTNTGQGEANIGEHMNAER